MEQYYVYHAAAPMSEEKAQAVLDLMEASFPAIERRERYRQQQLFANPLYHIVTVEEDGTIKGFLAFWTMRECTFFEHLAVKEQLRNEGIGGRILKWAQGALKATFVLEVEPPEDSLTCRRVRFYERHGFQADSRPYQQMPLRAGDAPVPMWLMTWPTALDEKAFIACRREIYREVYGIYEV